MNIHRGLFLAIIFDMEIIEVYTTVVCKNTDIILPVCVLTDRNLKPET